MNRIEKLIQEHCPKGVEFRPLGDVVLQSVGGGTPKRGQPEFWNGDIPWASVGDLTNTQIWVTETRSTITQAAVENSSTKVVKAGTLIVAVKIAPGTARIAATDIALNQDLRGLVLDPSISVEFLRYYFDALSIRGHGTIVKSITNKQLLAIRVPVPPPEVQREIVKVLDLFTKLEAELEARRKQYEYYRDQLLTFPEDGGATWAELGSVVEYINGKAHEKFVSPDGTIPLVTARFISRNGEANRWVRPEDVLTPAMKDDVALVLSDLPNGRALARTFFVKDSGSFAINQRVAILRTKATDKLLPRFLFFVMDRNRQLLRFDNGTDQTHLKKGAVQKLLLPLPPIGEQARIVEILDKFDALVNDLSSGLPAEIEARRKQYEYYRDKLLSFKELESDAA